mmetsp:Transcript_57314/g.119836  ORF Transcript_57314/g.119836 Transcript_57314/m.119836 type:complete len:225 (+) Transcript_57314:634-1308(+)
MLARLAHPLCGGGGVAGAGRRKPLQRVRRRRRKPGVEEPGGDHDTRAALAALAVHRDAVARIRVHEVPRALKKVDDLGESGRVVVLYLDVLHAAPEELRVVGPLLAEVEYEEPARVPQLEEALHLAHGVSVGRLRADGGEGHGDAGPGDVGQVEVETVLTEAGLVGGHGAADALGHVDLAQHQHQTHHPQRAHQRRNRLGVAGEGVGGGEEDDERVDEPEGPRG